MSDADELLEESADELYEDAPCGFLSTLADGTFIKVNRTFERWTGLSRADLVGHVRFQDVLTPGGRIYTETHLRPLLQLQGSVSEIALELVCADGRRLPVLVNSVLREGVTKPTPVIRMTIFDATDRREYERELLRSRERERTTALALQRAMLGDTRAADARCAIGTSYTPAVDTLEVGGDWHDAIQTGPDEMTIVVGDVVGKGLDAAATMGQLRSAVRALAFSGLAPGDLLVQLDRFAENTEPARGATLVIAQIDLASGRTRLACAGHPPPVLLPPHRDPTLVWEGRSLPLAIFGAAAARPEAAVSLAPGARMLLYSDGVVERRRATVDAGMERLAAAFTARRDEPIEDVAGALAADLESDEARRDDVCILAFELTAR